MRGAGGTPGPDPRAGAIVFNATSEFCRTLGEIPTYGLAGNREEQEELMVRGVIWGGKMGEILTYREAGNQEKMIGLGGTGGGDLGGLWSRYGALGADLGGWWGLMGGSGCLGGDIGGRGKVGSTLGVQRMHLGGALVTVCVFPPGPGAGRAPLTSGGP